MSNKNMSKSNQASPALRRKKRLIGVWGPYFVSVKKWSHKYWNIARSGKFLVQPNPEKTFIRIKLVGGFNPSEKYESRFELLFPMYGKIKNVPNISKPPNRKVTSLVLLVGKKNGHPMYALITSYNCVCNLLTKWDEPHKYPSYIGQFYSKPVVYLYHRERFVSWRNRCRDAQLPDFQRSRCELGVSKAGDTREDLRIRSLAERKFTGDVGCPPSYVCWYIYIIIYIIHTYTIAMSPTCQPLQCSTQRTLACHSSSLSSCHSSAFLGSEWYSWDFLRVYVGDPQWFHIWFLVINYPLCAVIGISCIYP